MYALCIVKKKKNEKKKYENSLTKKEDETNQNFQITQLIVPQIVIVINYEIIKGG